MPTARVREAVYRAIKRLLLDGERPCGSRLEARQIAQRLSVTVIPVREVFHQLAAEEMISYVPDQGFFVPTIDELRLRHIFEHYRNLLLIPIICSSTDSPAILEDGSYPDQAAGLFLQLASRSGNRELVAEISKRNDRLHPIRRFDPHIFNDTALDLEDIVAAANDDPSGTKLRSAIERYFHRRIAAVQQYIRLMTLPTDRPSSP
ncbi:GntR family transcriptional regulator [Sphingopyxis sp. LC81]|uniref:GntR family transcriptional regulator n=1 Tax=Sphingopyxis sp. LC81 TaxID=1502850 RepID=UPI0013781B94|nr:GntR family transcriptional regulator [Sphingopyxis sp. LC81]